jgi:hypothetical protein
LLTEEFDMAEKLMQAVQYNSYGGGASGLKVMIINFSSLSKDCLSFLIFLSIIGFNQHVEVPIPTPKINEVLIKLEATSINPVDWKIQKGQLRAIFFLQKFPYIPCISH